MAGSFAISPRRGKWSHQCKVFFPLNASWVEGIRSLSFAQCSEDPLLSGTPPLLPGPRNILESSALCHGSHLAHEWVTPDISSDTDRAAGPTQGFSGSWESPCPKPSRLAFRLSPGTASLHLKAKLRSGQQRAPAACRWLGLAVTVRGPAGSPSRHWGAQKTQSLR